jgi:hypothetical protein
VEGNGFLLGVGPGGVYKYSRDPATFMRSDPYTLDSTVQGAPTSGIIRLQPKFGEGMVTSLFKRDPYAPGEVIRGSSWFNPETEVPKAKRAVGEKPPAFIRVTLPDPTDFTGINLHPTDRRNDALASESLAERRALHEKRLIKSEADVKRFRFIGGVRFVDTEEDEEKMREELEQSARRHSRRPRGIHLRLWRLSRSARSTATFRRQRAGALTSTLWARLSVLASHRRASRRRTLTA